MLLQLSIAWKPSLFVSPFPPQGKEPAASSEAQTHFSSVPHTYWKSNFLGQKLYLATSYKGETEGDFLQTKLTGDYKLLEATI